MSRNLNQSGEIGPDLKRKRSLSRMTSAFLSTPMSKVGSVLQRSLSNAKLGHTNLLKTATLNRLVKSSSSVSNQAGGPLDGNAAKLAPYRPPLPTASKQRPSRYWSTDFPEGAKHLKQQDVKLQETIYEVVCGEEDFVSDLMMVLKNYGEPLMRLGILNHAEIDLLFGRLSQINSLHSDLLMSLRQQRCERTGISHPVGFVFLRWIESLREPYTDYCAGLIRTKAFIDYKRETDENFNDFLTRCLESGFSRKLDLWSYLDLPRSKLVKYPLLLRQIAKFSLDCDKVTLSSALEKLEAILHQVDTAIAEARCQFTISRLEWPNEVLEQKAEYVRQAREEFLDGTLKNKRGTKLECHLLDTVLILGRPANSAPGLEHASSITSLLLTGSTSSLMSIGSTASYKQLHSESQSQKKRSSKNSIGSYGKRLQVYRTPIPVEDMILEDLCPLQHQNAGILESTSAIYFHSFKHLGRPRSDSFRAMLDISSNTGFRVSSRQCADNQSHTLFAPDEHSKRQWMTALKKAIQFNQMSQHKDTRLSTLTKLGIPRSIQESSTIDENSVCEKDFVSNCSLTSPIRLKRTYTPDGKVTKIGGKQKYSKSGHTPPTCIRGTKKLKTSEANKKLQMLCKHPFHLFDELSNNVVLSDSIIKFKPYALRKREYYPWDQTSRLNTSVSEQSILMSSSLDRIFDSTHDQDFPLRSRTLSWSTLEEVSLNCPQKFYFKLEKRKLMSKSLSDLSKI